MFTGIMLALIWFCYFLGGLDLTFIIILSIGIIIIYPILPIGSANKLMMSAIRKLDTECDPYPLLLETEDQLTYVKNAGRRQLCMINHITATHNIGKSCEAYERLCAINIDLIPGTTFETKAIYYLNMSSFSLDVGKLEESVSYHAKASQIAGVIKNKKFKESLFSSLRAVAAEQAIYRKNFDDALALLSSVEVKSKKQAVDKTFLYSKIALGQGDKDNARASLLFVINNGNKLGCVNEAKKLLETL